MRIITSWLIVCVVVGAPSLLQAAEGESDVEPRETRQTDTAAATDSGPSSFPTEGGPERVQPPPDASSTSSDPAGRPVRLLAEAGLGLAGFAGMGGGVALGTYGLCLGYAGGRTIRREEPEDACLAAAALFGIPFAAFGLPTGVLLGGWWTGGKGAWWAPYAGFWGGLIVAGPLASVTPGVEQYPSIAAATIGTMALAGPILAFEWSHARVVGDERSEQASSPSLLPYTTLDHRGRLRVGIQGRF